MTDIDSEILTFPSDSEYKIGAVTYEVMAHFASEQDTLKSKIFTLISEEIYRQASGKIAPSQAMR